MDSSTFKKNSKTQEGADYDILAEPHSERVLFAGEATNRHFPQTGYFSLFCLSQIFFQVTGAFLSGLREAYRVFKYTDLDVKSEHREKQGDVKENLIYHLKTILS